jgi:hypothetical protein
MTCAAAYAQPLTTGEVQAETAPTNGVISFPVSFFADFRPTSASDMITRIPGFTFSGGDVVRGFAGAAGNVLIDGERPSSKSVTLDDALKRIPPGGVERIDLIRGGAPGIDMQGQPVVANIIRRGGAESTYAVDGTARFYHARSHAQAWRLEGARRQGALSLEGALYAQGYAGYVESGRGIFVRENGAGDRLASGPFLGRGELRLYQFNGSAEYRRPQDTFRLTAGLVQNEPLLNQYANLTTAAGLRTPETTLTHSVNRTAELGGDYQRRFSAGAVGRLIALYTYKHNTTDASTEGRGPFQLSGKDNTGGEAIVRGTVSLTHRSGLAFETGGELAFNYLDASSSLVRGGVPVSLPSANVRVEERRAEGFATVTYKPVPKLSLEAGARIETSGISQSGDATQKRSFTFIKPRFIAAYALRPSTQLRGRVERVVGQLDFEDFAASTDVASGVESAGNANLEPERAWLGEIALEQRFWGKGAIVLTATHRELEQVVDVIPIYTSTGVFSAPGNIGDGRRDDLRLSLTLPTERLRIAGGQLKFNATARKSRVTDPTTGEHRQITKVRVLDGDASYTQDFPSLNSTLIVESGTFGAKDRQYLVSEIQTVVEMATSKITWLYHPRPDLTVAVAVENFGSKERVRRREIYAGPRSLGQVATRELRSAELDPWFSLRLRKTF